MPQLDRRIEEWAQDLIAIGSLGEAGIDELTDHLYCLVISSLEAGLSEEDAFAAAVQKIGSQADLLGEFAKNRDLLSNLCAETEGASQTLFGQWSDSMHKRTLTLLSAGYLLVLAIAMVAAVRLWGGTDDFITYAFIIYAVWMVPGVLFGSRTESGKYELACLRRNIARILGRGE
jgi:hypothetical protein